MKFWLTIWIGLAALCAQPRLLLNEAEFDRIRSLAASERWAESARAAIVGNANAFPQAHLDKYGLKSLELPSEGGQWYHWYVCPTHGSRLAYRAPNTHRCPVDNRTFTGWPYDQYIYSMRNDDLAAAARDLALAWRFTGERKHAENAATILKLYAEKYLTWRYHDKDNRTGNSGGRAHSQTLDESIWLIPLAWSYDLLSGSDVLTAEERARIERDLLRAAVDTIVRNDAGISNWQSWHNAGIAAVGFALADQALIARAIDGKSGFRFQMQNSVVGEGFWYEGAWGYHFYALDALVQTAEMATRNGVDLWASEPNLANLFRAPLNLAFADNSLPPFNDSGTVNLVSQDRLYEAAYARTGDPVFLAVLGRRTRGRDAMIWGAPELPASTAVPLESNVFADSGFAVLRGAAPSDHAVMMKFGPHGGGHGHYDKLGFVSYARGGPLAVDPGTQAYAAPTHATWDLMTVAHNTLVLDEQRQDAATGKLLFFQKGDGFVAASADAGPAYRNASLQRTMVHTAEYTLDIAEAKSTNNSDRTIDWVYHNYGSLSTSLPMQSWTGFGRANGYQHLTGNKAAETGDGWQAVFDGTPRSAANYGGTYVNVSGIQARYETTPEQSVSGRFSGRMTYNFSAAQGYILFNTPALSNAPKTAPVGLAMEIYGDGSGHRLALRINDATDERWVVTVGPVNWTGWKRVEVTGIEKWTHYLGDNNGVFDGPARTVSVELTSVNGAPASGSLYVDDITLLYEGDSWVAETFELPTRSLRLTMLPFAGTTVVAGDGLGPDLTRPVPYVLARRRGPDARFVSLLEPFGDKPLTTAFREIEPGVFEVESDSWVDTIRVSADRVDYSRSTR